MSAIPALPEGHGGRRRGSPLQGEDGDLRWRDRGPGPGRRPGAKQELLQLQDAAYAYRDEKGKVRIHQAVSLTAAGAASGALWGTLIGMLFLMPVAGLAIGAGTGALTGKLADVGINDDTIKQIGGQLEQGRAAVFLLARSATVDRVIDAIKPFNPTVIQTNLTKEREEELVQALQS